MPHVRPFVVTGLIGLAATLFAAQAGAQQVYRIVGPDGRVTFSDKPPPQANAKVAPVVPLGGAAAGEGGGLPFELRQVTGKYPVTLYTANNCGPCGSGRAYLTSRGIPFTEKTISSPEDAEALKRLASDMSIPLLTVGGQQLKGYSEMEWGQYLDAAGYPPKSVLPASWRNPPASPLVALQRPAPVPASAGEDAAAAPGSPARSAPAERAENPAGIKF
ncbi:MAG: glutaredoxin-like protein [Ramlibacter sp.]|jgi:glutaredoxin|nr:glutaredoxin-like protein [Ramlibacter sp.]